MTVMTVLLMPSWSLKSKTPCHFLQTAPPHHEQCAAAAGSNLALEMILVERLTFGGVGEEINEAHLSSLWSLLSCLAIVYLHVSVFLYV